MYAAEQDFLTINDHPLRIDPGDSQVSIESLGAKLGIRISARWSELETVAAFRSAGLLPDYLEPEKLIDDPLVIRFSASRVFEAGNVPSGSIPIEEGKHQETYGHFYVDGIDYGLYFNGQLTLLPAQVQCLYESQHPRPRPGLRLPLFTSRTRYLSLKS